MVAKVYINNVLVGFLPIDQYEKIRVFAYKDKKNHILQIFNIFKIINNMIIETMKFILSLGAVLFFAFILFSPQEFTSFISFLKESSSLQITQLIRSIVVIGMIFGVFFLIIEISLFMNRFGYENAFQSSIERNVLQLLEIPERGNVYIHVEK